MNKIEVNNIEATAIVQNLKYPTTVQYVGVEQLPDIGIDYKYLQWGDEPWYEVYYVDLNNHIQSLSAEQLLLLETVTTNWEQPLGQEGNPTVGQVKFKKLSELKQACDLETNSITGLTTTFEPISWDKQEQLARNYLANPGSESLALDALAAARGFGETVEELASKIVAKADGYAVAYLGILGKFHKLSKDVELATTSEDIDVIVW